MWVNFSLSTTLICYDVYMIGSRSQDFVPIEDIKEGVVILKSGEYRSVIIASSLNLALKAEDEQLAIISGFQSFLNSLDFNLEICVQSRRFDIAPYIKSLNTSLDKAENDLLRLQISEYIEFIQRFVGEHNIMTKRFFVVIPYIPSVLSNMSDKGDMFLRNREQLSERVSIVVQGLSRFGVKSSQLNDNELAEMYYGIFNPGEFNKSIIT